MDQTQRTGVLVAVAAALVALVAMLVLKATVDTGVAGAVMDYVL